MATLGVNTHSGWGDILQDKKRKRRRRDLSSLQRQSDAASKSAGLSFPSKVRARRTPRRVSYVNLSTAASAAEPPPDVRVVASAAQALLIVRAHPLGLLDALADILLPLGRLYRVNGVFHAVADDLEDVIVLGWFV
ncbi:hypothetical protein TOPH_00642 [Tolypocladium ophioglossoides CBS 100239]|uniref:Uncharacterized protein n=1 Tax=Tolypocladium ophioglossoides (strain CBS 100239) TaxID=1163406 RepID=A0A0L0NLT8_TOLOC|nr:hypothetical protein TOPH_00642 [Tolypocladium ophioglossoides CBS 100239]